MGFLVGCPKGKLKFGRPKPKVDRLEALEPEDELEDELELEELELRELRLDKLDLLDELLLEELEDELIDLLIELLIEEMDELDEDDLDRSDGLELVDPL